MIRISDVMDKEVINVKNGKRLGYIVDIDIDVLEGKVVSFSIAGGSTGFFSRGNDGQVVLWSDILKIGYDTIIVNIGSDINLDDLKI